MKKINKSIMALMAALIVLPISCSKDFLETRPTDLIDAASVFQTIDGAWGAINGVHRTMYIQYNSSQAHGGMDGMFRHIEFLGSDVLFNTTANGWYLATYRWVDHRNERSAMVLYWSNLYRLISNVNQIIANVDQIPGYEDEKRHIKGQALAYRAWAHFMLVQLYADRFVPGAANSQPGVPYMDEISLTGKERLSVAETYNKINTDISEDRKSVV